MLIIMTPDYAGKVMKGPNAEWYQFDSDDEWILVQLEFEDLVGKHTQIIDWIAREIPYDVYTGLYDTKTFPSQTKIDKKLAEIDDWINAGKDTGFFKKVKAREKERAKREKEAKAPTKESAGYVFCFCVAKDALKFKLVWG